MCLQKCQCVCVSGEGRMGGGLLRWPFAGLEMVCQTAL
jgi:hypothetical protein